MSYPAGTLSIERIQDALYDWIVDITKGVFPQDDGEDHIIWRNQSQPLPSRPCVTLKIIDGPRPIGRSGSVFFNPVQPAAPDDPIPPQTNPFSVGIQMEATISIQTFGNTQNKKPMAQQLTIDINSSLMRQSVLDKLKMSGVSIQEVGKPRNLTALEETEYEERYGFEMTIGLAQNLSDEPGVIETVNLGIDTDQGDRTQVINLP